MPVMDGYEATRRIRAADHADAKTIPILAMTADAYDEDVQKCRAAGMNGHLSKPVDARQLFGALQKWCGAPEERDALFGEGGQDRW
jgi:CheY-like chemotaxis protein